MTRLFDFGFVRSLPFSGSLLSLWLSRSVSPAFVRGDFCPKDITHLAAGVAKIVNRIFVYAVDDDGKVVVTFV